MTKYAQMQKIRKYLLEASQCLEGEGTRHRLREALDAAEIVTDTLRAVMGVKVACQQCGSEWLVREEESMNPYTGIYAHLESARYAIGGGPQSTNEQVNKALAEALAASIELIQIAIHMPPSGEVEWTDEEFEAIADAIGRFVEARLRREGLMP